MIRDAIESSESTRRIWYSDLKDLFRWGRTLAAIFVISMVAVVQMLFGYLMLAPRDAVTTTKLIVLGADGFRMIVPVFGVLVGYDAIAADRETRRLRLYLSTPYVRSEFFFGKLLSRLSWTSLPVAAGLLVSALLAIALAGFRPIPILLFVAATLVLSSVFVSVSVAISAMVQTSRSALLVALGLLAIFYTSWWIPSIVGALFTWSTTGATVVSLHDPTAAYRQLFTALEGENSIVTLCIAGLSLTAWVVVPVVFGVSTFKRREI